MPTTQLSGSQEKVYKSSTTSNRKALACLVGIIVYYWVEVGWHDEGERGGNHLSNADSHWMSYYNREALHLSDSHC